MIANVIEPLVICHNENNMRGLRDRKSANKRFFWIVFHLVRAHQIPGQVPEAQQAHHGETGESCRCHGSCDALNYLSLLVFSKLALNNYAVRLRVKKKSPHKVFQVTPCTLEWQLSNLKLRKATPPASLNLQTLSATFESIPLFQVFLLTPPSCLAASLK